MESQHTNVELSIITVTFNSERWLPRYFESIFLQNFNHDFEIIVIDNGSTDETRSILAKMDDARIRVVESDNLGFGASNNLGARLARGSRLYFLNPDTCLESSCLQILFDKAVQGRVITPKIALLDNPEQLNTCGNRLHFTGLSFTEGYLRSREAYTSDKPVDGVSGAAFIITREDFERIGGFDEDFFLYMEDTEMSWRLHKSGATIHLSTASIVQHQYNMNMSLEQFFHLERGRLLLLRKHFTRKLFFCCLPSLLIAECLALAWSFRFGIRGVIAKVKAFWQGLSKELTSTWKTGNLEFCSQKIPFETISKNLIVHSMGKVINGIFSFNFIWLRLK